MPQTFAVATHVPNGPTLADKLTYDMPDLEFLTGLGLRTLRRIDADREIPGRLTVGRRVLFRAEAIREWVTAGMPTGQR